MIDAALHIIKRYRQLLTLSHETCEHRFTELIDPMYRDAQSVFQDYTALHLDLIVQLFTQQDVCEVITWIETRRLDFLPLCTQMRALTLACDMGAPNGNDALGKFHHGMISLIRGCAAFVDEQDVPREAYGYSGPTVLHQLYTTSQAPLPLHRGVYVDTAKKHFQALEHAWEDAVEGYAAIKYHYQASQKRMAGCKSAVTNSVNHGGAQREG